MYTLLNINQIRRNYNYLKEIAVRMLHCILVDNNKPVSPSLLTEMSDDDDGTLDSVILQLYEEQAR